MQKSLRVCHIPSHKLNPNQRKAQHKRTRTWQYDYSVSKARQASTRCSQFKNIMNTQIVPLHGRRHGDSNIAWGKDDLHLRCERTLWRGRWPMVLAPPPLKCRPQSPEAVVSVADICTACSDSGYTCSLHCALCFDKSRRITRIIGSFIV